MAFTELVSDQPKLTQILLAHAQAVNWYRTHDINAKDAERYATPEFTSSTCTSPMTLFQHCSSRSSRVKTNTTTNSLPRTIDQPTLYVAGLKDTVLLPSMAANMHKSIPKLSTAEVNTSHWAMLQDPEGVNRILGKWLDEVVFGGKSNM